MALAEPDVSRSLTPRKTQHYGWRPDLPDSRDRIFNLEEKVEVTAALPPRADLSPNMPGIYDQGQLGSCTGNGIARVLEYGAIKQGEAPVTPSRLFLYYNERVIEGTVSQDSGAQIRDGIKVVVHQGVPPESDWPYDIGQFAVKPSAQAYADATRHEALVYKRILLTGPGDPVRTALASGSPVVFGFSVPAYFEPGGGNWDPTRDPLPVPGPSDKIIGGHCVVLSGYDDTRTRFPSPAFQVENSWGTGWGMAGRFWMDAAWFAPHAGLASDLWVITKVM